MDNETFVRFIAFLLFAFFNVYWEPKFRATRLRWLVFVLQCVGVAGALWLLLWVY